MIINHEQRRGAFVKWRSELKGNLAGFALTTRSYVAPQISYFPDTDLSNQDYKIRHAIFEKTEAVNSNEQLIAQLIRKLSQSSIRAFHFDFKSIDVRTVGRLLFIDSPRPPKYKYPDFDSYLRAVNPIDFALTTTDALEVGKDCFYLIEAVNVNDTSSKNSVILNLIKALSAPSYRDCYSRALLHNKFARKIFGRNLILIYTSTAGVLNDQEPVYLIEVDSEFLAALCDIVINCNNGAEIDFCDKYSNYFKSILEPYDNIYECYQALGSIYKAKEVASQ